MANLTVPPGGRPPSPASWTYDGAANRSNSGYAYDNLNRMTASPSVTYENDIVGNRTWKNYGQSNVQRTVWDNLNRLSSACGLTTGAKYHYRADGLRIRKVEGLTVTWVDDGSQQSKEESSGHYDEVWSTNKPTTRYFYDGQMVFEEDFAAQSASPNVRTVTRYGLGARGIDLISTTDTQSTETIAYPLYDGHGNMVATLAKNGLSYTLGNQRTYDAWGGIMAGATSGSPNTRYSANLGHKQDDESGLLYMRARYYETGTGRFISEDPAMHGWNWYAYCNNDPIANVDFNGKEASAIIAFLRLALRPLGIGVIEGYYEYQDEAKQGDVSWVRVTLKTAQGMAVGYVASSSISAIVSIWTWAIGCSAFGGFAATAAIATASYATLLILFLDFAFIDGTSNIIDAVTSAGG